MKESDSPFPILDFEREDTTNIADIGIIDAYVEEMDWWATMPVRLAHHLLSGVCIEFGPYTLDEDDIRVLRRAVIAYDLVEVVRDL